jgi:hypothetical protein
VKPYDRVLAIAKHYLGPAAESFLARQCQLALKIDALAMTSGHFKDLAHQVEVAACRFIEAAKAKEMAGRIATLAAT